MFFFYNLWCQLQINYPIDTFRLVFNTKTYCGYFWVRFFFISSKGFIPVPENKSNVIFSIFLLLFCHTSIIPIRKANSKQHKFSSNIDGFLGTLHTCYWRKAGGPGQILWFTINSSFYYGNTQTDISIIYPSNSEIKKWYFLLTFFLFPFYSALCYKQCTQTATKA